MSGIIWKVLLGIVCLAVVALIVFVIYLVCAYGGKPIDEIPFWVLWFIWG